MLSLDHAFTHEYGLNGIVPETGYFLRLLRFTTFLGQQSVFINRWSEKNNVIPYNVLLIIAFPNLHATYLFIRLSFLSFLPELYFHVRFLALHLGFCGAFIVGHA